MCAKRGITSTAVGPPPIVPLGAGEKKMFRNGTRFNANDTTERVIQGEEYARKYFVQKFQKVAVSWGKLTWACAKAAVDARATAEKRMAAVVAFVALGEFDFGKSDLESGATLT